MSSFEYIESAVIFNLTNKENLRSFPYATQDFSIHGEVYKFLIDFFDKHGEFPDVATLCHNYPYLDKTANSVNYEYALDIFKDQILHRKVVSTINSVRDTVKTDPKTALSRLMIGLTDIEVSIDEDINSFSENSSKRLDEWRDRADIHNSDEGMMGIPTSLISINNTGVGWMGGDLIGLYARPMIGKTWMAIHSAATAIYNKKRTLFISAEQSVSSINMRLDVVLGKLLGYDFNHSSLRNGSQIDESRYLDYLEEIKGLELLVCDHISGRDSITVESIASLVRKHNPEFVIIDGIYLIDIPNKAQASWEKNHELVHAVKNLAKARNIPIMVITQANREARNIYEPPKPSHVAFGDGLMRAADVVLSMCQLENDESKRILEVQKYREGELAGKLLAMDWNVNNGTIKELPNFNFNDF